MQMPPQLKQNTTMLSQSMFNWMPLFVDAGIGILIFAHLYILLPLIHLRFGFEMSEWVARHDSWLKVFILTSKARLKKTFT